MNSNDRDSITSMEITQLGDPNAPRVPKPARWAVQHPEVQRVNRAARRSAELRAIGIRRRARRRTGE